MAVEGIGDRRLGDVIGIEGPADPKAFLMAAAEVLVQTGIGGSRDNGTAPHLENFDVQDAARMEVGRDGWDPEVPPYSVVHDLGGEK